MLWPFRLFIYFFRLIQHQAQTSAAASFITTVHCVSSNCVQLASSARSGVNNDRLTAQPQQQTHSRRIFCSLPTTAASLRSGMATSFDMWKLQNGYWNGQWMRRAAGRVQLLSQLQMASLLAKPFFAARRSNSFQSVIVVISETDGNAFGATW